MITSIVCDISGCRMRVHKVKGKLAVITGGSSGLGYAIAEALAKQGFHLLLVARNITKLQASATQIREQFKVNVTVISVDVTQTEDIKRLNIEVKKLGPCADLIVNSAGIVSAGFLDDTPLQEWERLYHVNILGLVSVLQGLLPDMKLQSKLDGEERHIVNISSAAAYTGLPGMSGYAASKAALIALSEVLAHEVFADNIGVSVICPEFVNTPIGQSLQLFGRLNNTKSKQVIKKMFERSTLNQRQLALATLQAIEKKKGLIPVGKQATLSYHFKRLMPNIFFKYLEYKLNNGLVSKASK